MGCIKSTMNLGLASPTIEFWTQYISSKGETYRDGVRISDYSNCIPNMSRPNDIVVTTRDIAVVFKYPLSRPVTVHMTAKRAEGFTRADLATQICAAYHRIYAEEEAAIRGVTLTDVMDEHLTIFTNDSTPTVDGMYNRDTSPGPHGIWGHYIDDLVLVNAKLTSEGVYTLGVDS